MTGLMTEPEVVVRVFAHIDQGAIELSDVPWGEPVASYLGGALRGRAAADARTVLEPVSPGVTREVR